MNSETASGCPVTFSSAFSFFWEQGEDSCFFGCLVNFFGFSLFPGKKGRHEKMSAVPASVTAVSKLNNAEPTIIFLRKKKTTDVCTKLEYTRKWSWSCSTGPLESQLFSVLGKSSKENNEHNKTTTLYVNLKCHGKIHIYFSQSNLTVELPSKFKIFI